MIAGAAFAGLATLLPAVAVYLLLVRVWSGTEDAPGRALAAVVAPGLAIGVSSFLYFGLLQLAPNRRTAVWIDLLVWLSIALWLMVNAARRRASASDATTAVVPLPRLAARPVLAVMAAGCLLLFALAAWSFWLHYTIKPDGEWDAFAIWNLRARAIARGAPDWAAVLSPDLPWSQPNYPLLLPLSVARLWAYAGGESTTVPAAVALLFLVSSAAVVVVGVGRLRGWSIGLLSGMALLMSRTYVFQGACQCGDVPFGFYVLVAVCFVAMSRYSAVPGPLLVTAGAAAGLGAWAKNEGMLLLALIVLATLLRRRSRLRALAHLVAGAAVPALLLFCYKLQVGSSSYLIEQQGGGTTLEKLIDGSRWSRVADRLAVLVPAWGAVPGGALVWLGVAVLLTLQWNRNAAARAGFPLLLVLAMLAGYILVYVITPLPLEWQMNVSFDRLLVQLWPALVWSAFQFSGDADTVRPRSTSWKGTH